jgi:hypothetical protein
VTRTLRRGAMRVRDLPADAMAHPGFDPLEEEFTEWVVDRATERGWHVVHYRKAASRKGYKTPVLGMVGGPDVLCARDGVVILAELKRNRSYLKPEQKQWAAAIGNRYHRVWRPRDAHAIIQALEEA